MRLLLIGNKKTLYSLTRLSQEGKKYFKTIDVVNWRELIFYWNNNNLQVKVNDKNLNFYTHIITRIAGDYFLQRYLLVQKAKNLGCRCLNEKMISKLIFYDKLIQFWHLSLRKIPLLPTYQFLNFQNLFSPFSFPLIIKGRQGERAQKVWRCSNLKQLQSFFKTHSYRNYFLQPFIPAGFDLRIMVIGNQIVGAYKRIAKKSFKTIRGGINLPYQPTPEEKKIALKAARALEGECVGVDLIYHQNQVKVLEVNLDAGFKTFEKITKINIAQKIINQLIKNDK